MTASLLLFTSLGTMTIGAVAIYIGTRGEDGNMLAKVGGSFIFAIGLLGLIAGLILH